IAKDESLYQSLDPQNLGIKSNIALGMQSGISAISLALKQIDRAELIGDRDLVAKILKEIKEISKRGTPINIERELPLIVESCFSINQSMR
ncbi:MAG: 2-isopropylmalate synthase, partial [Pseudanabaena sp. LacPavin_0818_WC45_MAG_42_6]|nr:2-isopropylmalate synthase [Pseudanabaena sp. LacPavin_0818_WC45_MAG_42_6]